MGLSSAQACSTAASAAAPLFAVMLAWNAALAGTPVPAAPPAPPPQALVDPNDPEPASPPVAVPSAPADPAKVEKGQRMYKDFCQKCHGMNMVSPGGGFFDLRTFPRDDKARFVQSVTNGKRAMPAWGAVLRPDDIDIVWAYISSTGNAR